MGNQGPAGETRPTDSGGFWNRFYDASATTFGEDPFPFMNLGFADPESPDTSLADARGEIAERLSERLYDQTLAHVNLQGKTVLEVGCGRGGGCAHMARTQQPGELIGVDLSGPLVELCTETHRYPGLRFAQGEAAQLPVADDSIEIVVNVESSHCYSSRLHFFEEVARVLKPGGRLAITDILFLDSPDNSPAAIEGLLTQAGLEVLTREDVTPGVLAARDLASHSSAFRARLEAAMPDAGSAAIFDQLYCLQGSPYYESLKSGAFAYWAWTAAAPG